MDPVEDDGQPFKHGLDPAVAAMIIACHGRLARILSGQANPPSMAVSPSIGVSSSMAGEPVLPRRIRVYRLAPRRRRSEGRQIQPRFTQPTRDGLWDALCLCIHANVMVPLVVSRKSREGSCKGIVTDGCLLEDRLSPSE